MAHTNLTAASSPPLDQARLVKIARDAELELRNVCEHAGRVCPPKDVLIERLVESFSGLGSRVLAPLQGMGTHGRFDVASLGIVARRYFLDGAAIQDCDIGENLPRALPRSIGDAESLARRRRTVPPL